MGNFPAVLNFNRDFLKLNRFNCNSLPVLPESPIIAMSSCRHRVGRGFQQQSHNNPSRHFLEKCANSKSLHFSQKGGIDDGIIPYLKFVYNPRYNSMSTFCSGLSWFARHVQKPGKPTFVLCGSNPRPPF